MASCEREIRFHSQLPRRNCQTFSTGFDSGHLAGSGTIVMLGRNREPVRDVLAGLIDQERAVLARRDPGGGLGQVKTHRLRIAPGQDQTGCSIRRRTDGAEDIARRHALVLRRWRSCPTLGPAPGDLLLPDPSFVGEPHLYAAPICDRSHGVAELNWSLPAL